MKVAIFDYMQKIISAIDKYLERTQQTSIGPVEANAMLEKEGLLKDSSTRKGKPLRELLRTGNLPHAYQLGNKWSIPHSKNKVVSKIIIPIKNETLKTTSTKTDFSSSIKILLNEKHYKNASEIDNIVPHSSGLYCIRIKDINKLPTPFNSILLERKHNIIYLGIATKSLHKRFLNQELRANGHGTFFRSIGAMLGYKPIKGSLISKGNKRNYKFSLSDEKKIINWINTNLIVNWIEYVGDLETIETELISLNSPLVNLAKNPYALKLISDLRAECVRVANYL